jgi:hypothetical protein
MRNNVRALVLDVLKKVVMGRIAEVLAKEKKQTRVCTYMDGRMVRAGGGGGGGGGERGGWWVGGGGGGGGGGGAGGGVGSGWGGSGGMRAEESVVWIIQSDIACLLLFMHLYFVIFLLFKLLMF